jgi:two-component system LytT family response regulator
LLKPVEKARLRETINRAHERLEQKDFQEIESRNVKNAVEIYEESKNEFIERIPVKLKDEIIFVNVSEIASIVADGELLHITNIRNQKYVINFRLKDIEAKLSPSKFIRLSRGALANIEMFEKISPMPGGTYQITMKNGQEISTSRLQSRVLRERLLKL